MLWFYKKQERKDARLNGIVLYNSELAETTDPSEASESDRKMDIIEQKCSI